MIYNFQEAIEFADWLVKRVNHFAYLYAYAMYYNKLNNASEFSATWNYFYDILKSVINRYNIEIKWHRKENGPVHWPELEVR